MVAAFLFARPPVLMASTTCEQGAWAIAAKLFRPKMVSRFRLAAVELRADVFWDRMVSMSASITSVTPPQGDAWYFSVARSFL